MTACLRFSPPDFPVLFAALVWVGLVLLTYWVSRRPKMPGRSSFMVAHFAMLWWLLGATLELATPVAECKVFWAEVTWPAIVLMPTAWALFLFGYTQADERPRLRFRIALMIAGPAFVTAIVSTNPIHHAFYGTGTSPVEVAGRLSMVYDHGPLFYVASGYSYLFLAASLTILLLSIRRAEQGHRGFLVTLLAVTLVPIAANLSYIIGGYTLFGFDPTPFMFVFVLAAFGVLLVNNRMMDINVLTRDILFFRSTDPILVIDSEGCLESANPKARTVFDGALPEPGATILAMPDMGPLAARLLGEGQHDEPVVAHGDRRYLVRSVPLVSPMLPHRPALGWAIQLLDITAQERAADALREAAETAEAANIAKSQFLSTVSHELRTPLTSIKGSLDLLAAGAFGSLSDQAKNAAEIAMRNSNRLAALVDDLLDLQRIELDAMAVEQRPVDLTQLVAEAVEAAEGYGHALGVNLSVTLPDGPTIVRGDHARLLQVMANVLSNALKFSERGGNVDVVLTRSAENARIEIRDEGIGIPEEFRDKLFEPFRQADPSASRQFGGAGLGLSITRNILNALSGRIDFESSPGTGTTCIIELPLAEPAT